MAEYIKRMSAMTICERYGQHCFEQNDAHGQHIADSIFDDVVNIPTADVVEVVKCKDCKHWGGVTFGYICRRFSGSYIRNETRECDFCSFGERKDGAE